ncbi:MAG: OmpA family protein [Bacteroidales bacterium]|nr:OmpA family protein [Bacteroidales bacterium]
MKRIALTLIALSFAYAGAYAQNFLERLKDRTKDNIENRIENRVEQKVDDAVDNALDKLFNPKKKEKKADEERSEERQSANRPEVSRPKTERSAKAERPDARPSAKTVKSEYAKSDFVPGDEIFFEDDFERERLGEFPLRWDLLDGYVETASIEGRKVLAFTDDGLGQVIPNMKEKWAWLPEDFTVEYDLFIAPLSEDSGSTLDLSLCFGAGGQQDYYNYRSSVRFFYREDGSSSMDWSLKKPGSDMETRGDKALGLSSGNSDYNSSSPVKAGEWNHFAFSFNKRAFKGYINGMRIINVPSMEAPGYFFFNSGSEYRYSGISNVRIAKGAVPLYDRLLSDGKIVTYAITFETGKADLKPESMVEINRVAKLMKEYPDLEFEVQGHCDNTGSDRVNDPLSQKRAEAIVSALADLGISESRLTPVGKGSHEPVASNKTDEGRSKNRRVEFVKK